MKAPELIVKPWQLVTIRMRMAAGWRFRWSLGFRLIQLGSRLIAHKVEISVEGQDGDRSAAEARIAELEGIVARKTRLINDLVARAAADRAP